MRFVVLSEDEVYEMIERRHNPPVIRDQADEQVFEGEVRAKYQKLLSALSRFGVEGDRYGVSDFAIRPSPCGPIHHVREFTVTILSESFFRSHYLESLHTFLTVDAIEFRIWIDQHFDSEWIHTLILESDLAQIYCSKPTEMDRTLDILRRL